jgi:CheY-like chemotaxis protein
VDDDDDMLEIVGLVLGSAGYAARVARNGRQALDAVAEAMPALILLDMLMPVMDGWEFVNEFRARYGGDVPIVVVTAAEHARARCSPIEVSEVLTKPFDVHELLRVVARHLEPAPAG